MNKLLVVTFGLMLLTMPQYTAQEIGLCEKSGSYTIKEDGVLYLCNDDTLEAKTTYYDNGNKLNRTYYFEDGSIDRIYFYYDNVKNSIQSRETYQANVLTEVVKYNDAYFRTEVYTYLNNILTTDYKYSADGYVKTIYYTDGIMPNEVIGYNNYGQRTSYIKYAITGMVEVQSIYNSDGSYTKTTYHSNSKQIREVIKYNNNGQRIENVKYDAKGIKQEYYHYNNGVINASYTYYPSGKVKSRLDYDRSGRKTRYSTYLSNGYKENTYYYAANGIKTGSNKYINNIRRFKYVYNSNGSYTKAFYNRQGVKEKTEYMNKYGKRYKVVNHLKTIKDKGYTSRYISVCNLSGKRYNNAVVDVGFDSSYANRNYYGYTNKYGQLVKVEAAQLIHQDEKFEKVVSGTNGKTKEMRYCKDEARVKGTENIKYAQGHVIADSWGGAANSFNITPEYSWVNLYGGQYKMEKDFRNGLKNGHTITDFEMKIYYRNSKTNIPYKYVAKYKIDGKSYARAFANKKG